MGVLVVLTFVLSFCNVAEMRPATGIQNRSSSKFEFSQFGETNETCNLILKDPLIIDTTNNYFEGGADLVVFNMEIIGYTWQDSKTDDENNVNPLQWILTNSPAGKALLVLPGRYMPLSLYTLSYGIHELDVILQQTPDDCIGSTNDTDIKTKIQAHLRQAIFTSFGSQDSQLSPDIEVCNADTTDGEIQYQCCTSEPDRLEICEQVKASAKMKALLILINVLPIIILLYSPAIVPPSLYLWSTAETYTIQLPQDENRLTFEKESEFDETEELKLKTFEDTSKDIKIQVNSDKVVSCNKSVGPYSFIWYFYENSKLVTEYTDAQLCCCCCCCKQNDGCLENSGCRVVFRKIVSCSFRIFRLLVLISPFILIFFFISQMEHKQIIPFIEPYFFYNDIAVYIAFALLIETSFVTLIISENLIQLIKTDMVVDMKLSITRGISFYVELVSCSFKKLGKCATVILLPFSIVGLLAAFPLFQVYYKILCGNGQWYIKDKLFKPLGYFIIFHVTVIYFVTFVFLSFFVNCLVYTIIGVVINADIYAQYVAFFSIIVVYGFKHFTKVTEVFTKFNKTLQTYIQKKYSKLSNTEPGANSATLIDSVDRKIKLKKDASGRYLCSVPGLVLFKNSNGTPRISKRFLSKFTRDIHHQFPEKPHVLYMRALVNLVSVTIFLVFVFLVVFAFGRANGISSAGKFILAVSSSILPFLLRYVLFNIGTEEKSETDLEGWKVAFNKVLENYKEYWVIDPINFDGNENVASTCTCTCFDNESTHLELEEEANLY